MIKEVVTSDRMPPWHSDAPPGTFVNERRLLPEEKRLILEWIDAGAPEGDPADLPPPRPFHEGWSIKSDVVVPMAATPFDVPAQGPIEYQWFTAQLPWKDERWIRAYEIRPGNRSVVHHCVIFAVTPPEGVAAVDHVDVSNLLMLWAPGYQALELPPGTAQRLPAGSQLLFMIHYEPNGTPQTDLTSIAFQFADPSSVTQEARWILITREDIAIPPRDARFLISAETKLLENYELLSMVPHMHLRGKSFEFDAVYPNGKKERLLNVPNYDFEWQQTYMLTRSKPIPKGTTIRTVGVYDNSANNPSNPDPNATVVWGELTFNEMFDGYIQVTTPRTATQPLPVASPGNGRPRVHPLQLLILATSMLLLGMDFLLRGRHKLGNRPFASMPSSGFGVYRCSPK